MEQDRAESVKWFSKSAAQGNVEAMYNLGWVYSAGEGVAKSTAEAVGWYEKAVAKNHRKAHRNLAPILYYGIDGIGVDKRRGMLLWEKAVELGDVEAAALLGKLYMEGDADTPQDLAQGIRYLKVAANSDDGYSMFLLAVAYRDGQGVARNNEVAQEWFHKARHRFSSILCVVPLHSKYNRTLSFEIFFVREAGYVDVEELYLQGCRHLSGEDGVEYSLFEAMKLFMGAADAGHARAMLQALVFKRVLYSGFL
jgi:TPR repeat protein